METTKIAFPKDSVLDFSDTYPDAPKVTLPNGTLVTARLVRDDTNEAPWENSDIHGPVRQGTIESKRPGERVLFSEYGRATFYDAREAMKIAKRDWVRKDDPAATGTIGERAAKLVEDDFAFLKAWCDDEWFYVGVVLKAVRPDGYEKDYVESLWGIESNADSYLLEVANDLLAEFIASEAN